MAEKAKKSNTNLIIGICVATLVIVVVAVAIFFATRGTSQLNDAYFVSDGTKYVLTVNDDMLNTDEDTEYIPIKTHVVYTYSGDTITSMTTYLEFANEATAKSALDYYSQKDQSGVKNISSNSKYVVVEMTDDQYSEMTAPEVKEYIDFIENIRNVDLLNDADSTEETTTENEK